MARQTVTNKFLKAYAKKYPRKGKKQYGGPHDERVAGGIPVGLWVWMNDMALWGQAVRQDIKRIEEGLGLAAGDPGDPPPPPPDDLE